MTFELTSFVFWRYDYASCQTIISWLPLRKATGVVESFGCLIIFYIGLKCHFNYFVLYIYIYIYIWNTNWSSERPFQKHINPIEYIQWREFSTTPAVFICGTTSTDEYRRCGGKFGSLYIFYWIKVFLKSPFAVSLSVLFITIQYAVFRKSIRTFYVQLYIYIYIAYDGSIILGTAQNIARTNYTRIKFNFRATHYPTSTTHPTIMYIYICS